MTFNIILEERVKKEDLPNIPKANALQIIRALDERLAVDPVGCGKPLQYKLKGAWRLRVGDWRVLYRIKGKEVTVFAIDLRRDAY